jgi:hypothetical protein
MVFHGLTLGFGFMMMNPRFVGCHSGSQKLNHGTLLTEHRRVISAGFHFTRNAEVT